MNPGPPIVSVGDSSGTSRIQGKKALWYGAALVYLFVLYRKWGWTGVIGGLISIPVGIWVLYGLHGD